MPVIVAIEQAPKISPTVPCTAFPAATLAAEPGDFPVYIWGPFSVLAAAQQVRVYPLADLQWQGEEGALRLSLSCQLQSL